MKVDDKLWVQKEGMKVGLAKDDYAQLRSWHDVPTPQMPHFVPNSSNKPVSSRPDFPPLMAELS